jgi:ferredoxin
MITLHSGDCNAGTAYLVYGTIRLIWIQMSTVFGYLGWPVNDVCQGVSSVTGYACQYQWFEGKGDGRGIIMFHENGPSQHGTFEAHGPLGEKYHDPLYGMPDCRTRQCGDPDTNTRSGIMGLLTSSDSPAAPSAWTGGGWLNRCENGSIYLAAGSHVAHVVYGDISAQYEATGGTGGPYGFPTGDPVVSGGVTSQTFEGGTISVGPRMSISPTALVDFGSVQVGQCKDLDAYNVTNIGTGTLTGSVTGVAASFSVVSGSPFSLTAGQSQVVRIRFCPTIVGSHGCHVWFVSNANSIDGNLQGRGTCASPAAPSGLTVTSVSSSQINFSWQDNSTDETGFKIERRICSSGAWSQSAAVGANVTAYQDPGLAAATCYAYRVRAYNSCGNSAYSNEASATTIRTVFCDVSSTDSSWPYVNAIYQRGITTGCRSGSGCVYYCPNDSITRAQMAVFLCRAAGRGPLDRATPTFCDVPKTHSYYGWIERVADAASWNGNPPTIGCAAFPCKKFCPSNAVRRDEMAAFLVRATGKSPMPSCSGTFADVLRGGWACPYVERVSDPGSWGGTAVTSGCVCPSGYPSGAKCYCPAASVTRGQMAVFLVRAFGIPL